jgi:hypothetical protein
MPQEPKVVSPPLIALSSWMVPGLGYWLLGERSRAMVVGITIVLLFLAGILVAGIRVIEVPGFDEQGRRVMVRTGAGPQDQQWILTARPIGEIANKPWYVLQILAGPINLIGSKFSVEAVEYPKVKARIGEIGTLYTAVAGMLNLLAIIDAAHRAAQRAV